MLKPIAAAVLIATAALSAPATAAAAPVQEDEAGWSCVTDGNRICGPGNSNGVTAGCYDDTGAMVAAWPCFVVVDQNGDADVYIPDAR